MLNKARIRSASPKANVYGFITDWNIVLIGEDGRTLRDNVPGDDSSDIVFGDLENRGMSLLDVFETDDVRGFYDAKDRDAKASALGRIFGASAMVPDGYIIGTKVADASVGAAEWSTRRSRTIPAKIPGTGLVLNDRSREVLTMVAFEGHHHMDWAAYYQALMEYTWGHKFAYPDDYLYDGFVSNCRSMADGDPGFIRDFLETYIDDVRHFDCPTARAIMKAVRWPSQKS